MIATVSLALLSIASLALAWIDLRRGLIPDWLNLVIALIGLARVAALDGAAAALIASCEGITVGVTVWMLGEFYFRLRKVQGLGLGDVKLLAASGVWIGLVGVPVQLLVASLTALAAAATLKLAGRAMTRQTSLPFGPFLVLGLLTALWIEEAGGLRALS
jgi:leader peptidase (prepilin peptidase)/N-methyltransferase